MFQSYALTPRSAWPTTSALRWNAQDAQPDRKKRIDEWPPCCRSPICYRRPSQLSGGQRQRVARAGPWLASATVFVRRAVSNLDAKLRVEMRAEIKRLHQASGITSVYVTHDQVEAMTLGSRIAVMKGGVVQQLGTPDEIYNRPANTYVATFIGSPTMNLLRGTQAAGHFAVQGASLDLSAPPASAEVCWRFPCARDMVMHDAHRGRHRHVVEPTGPEKRMVDNAAACNPAHRAQTECSRAKTWDGGGARDTPWFDASRRATGGWPMGMVVSVRWGAECRGVVLPEEKFRYKRL